MRIWTDAVTNAIRRHVEQTGSSSFTRQSLIAAEIGQIEAETQTRGLTPTQTLGRELQELRDAGLIEFKGRGTYRWLGVMPEPEPTTPSNGIFVLDESGDDQPERRYSLPSLWAHVARRMIGQWIIYQAPLESGGDYIAAAHVARIDPDPAQPDRSVVRIREGSYLEFGRAVPVRNNGSIVEHGLRGANGQLNVGLAARPVRAISNADFNWIVGLGLIAEEDVLPRIDGNDAAIPPVLELERDGWEGPVDRTTMLVNRTVRDRQFRKRVLDIYGGRCALTGMKLINGGGRVETEAAHIKSVSAGGPDKLDNGIALSGTIHWMFDRGLISLSDGGEILLSRAINDRDSVERLIFPDRKARFPVGDGHRPHPRYLHWHRTECFHD